jgi:hypothetical protein
MGPPLQAEWTMLLIHLTDSQWTFWDSCRKYALTGWLPSNGRYPTCLTVSYRSDNSNYALPNSSTRVEVSRSHEISSESFGNVVSSYVHDGYI